MPTATDGWSEPTVLRLIERSADKDPIAIIEAYAARCLREANAGGLPIDVEGIASHLGIRIRVAEHPFAGRVHLEETGSLVIDLNARDSEVRRRFTCAHEVMHTAFPGFRRDSRYRVDRAVGAQQRSRGEEEYLCDRGAAALLMPASSLGALYEAGRGLGDVERLASAARVSLEAAAIRLVTLAERPLVFMVFDWAHKPADIPRLRRGEEPDKKLRIRYGLAAGLVLRIPRFVSAPVESIFVRALEANKPVRGVSGIPGVSSERRFLVEAKAYGRSEPGERRVLALAAPIG